ncbi:9780_t:CDS:2, partial [Funneliformis geosporum]
PAVKLENSRKTENLLYFSTHKMFEAEPDRIPSSFKLLGWLQELFSQPIEIPKMIYEIYIRPNLPEQDSNKFFRSSDEFSFRVMSNIITIINSPTTGNTKDFFHSFWDALIIKPINITCPNGKYNRNSSSNTSTKKLCPDFLYTLDGACLTRGKEKGPNTDNDPAEKLTSKLIWTYGSYPYIFGYYACGFDVTYCYLYNEDNQKKHWLIITLIRKGLGNSFHKEFYIIHQPNSQKIIELMQNVVVKRYTSKADFPAKLEKIYRMMDDRQVPYVDHIVQMNKRDNEKLPNIIFSPKGLIHRPSSMKQLVIALYCVLSALKIHSPEIFKDFHDTSVDMWSIGYLIMTAHVELPINETLREYAMELMKEDAHISAKIALGFLWQNYQEILIHEGFFRVTNR